MLRGGAWFKDNSRTRHCTLYILVEFALISWQWHFGKPRNGGKAVHGDLLFDSSGRLRKTTRPSARYVPSILRFEIATRVRSLAVRRVRDRESFILLRAQHMSLRSVQRTNLISRFSRLATRTVRRFPVNNYHSLNYTSNYAPYEPRGKRTAT